MKHLIAFLGYTQSRVQHPVYRQFVQAPISRRNTQLLFQSRPLEERELLHEVNELRKREIGPCEVSFHLCATLDNANIGQQLVQTITLIKRLFDCTSYVYCLLPNLDTCSEEQRKAAWKSLVALNNLITDYPNVQLMSHCFLYHDATQVSLARFLYSITQQPESLEELGRSGFMSKLVSIKRDNTSFIPEFPAIFSTFNAAGITYPEDEIRYYLHQNYLSLLLAKSRPETNPISMEQCNIHVQEILSSLPIEDEQISLCGESFLTLPDEATRIWPKVDEYWSSSLQKALNDLDDLPKEIWLNQIKNTLHALYENRFRDMGVNFYFTKEKKRTDGYANILLSLVRNGLHQVMVQNPYPPETSQDIVRSIVNQLQQQSFGINRLITDCQTETEQLKVQLAKSTEEWEKMGFFDRLRGRDKASFEQYKEQILSYYVLLTKLSGYQFASKLLNELIPQVSSLGDSATSQGILCQGALTSILRYLEDETPENICPQFPVEPIYETLTAMQADQSQLISDYKRLVETLYGHTCPVDSDSLLQQLRDDLHEEIDSYIFKRIENGSFPPVLDEPLTGRIADIFVGRGGFKAFIEGLKKQTALSLKIKGEGRRNEQYLLIAPDGEEVGPHITSNDVSNLQMLHILSGISLQDLEGFSGQRMFVEPSIF